MQQTVMIVDDSLPIHTLVKKQLEAEPFGFHSIYDGAGAISAAVSLRPDLILLDVDMPRTNGFEACQYLKANPLTASIPLIFLSGDSLVADKVKGLEMGAVDYIVKPFRPDELRARIRSALRTKPETADGRMAGGLAGVWTKPYFDFHLQSHLAQAQRHGRPLSCVVADMDCWGVINSKVESTTIKEIIRSVGRAFVLRCRTEDTIMQFENGRFILLLGDTTRHAASKMVDRLRSDVMQLFGVGQNAGVIITYSFGISDTNMTDGTTLVERAILAAQRAHRRGGNCVAVARTSPAISLAA